MIGFFKAVIQDIDEGNFDVVDPKFLFRIKEDYLIVQPLAVKAKLIS